MPAAAVAEFTNSLGLARELISLEALYADPPSPADTPKVEALRGGAVVLMVAAFEQYLRALFAEHLSGLLGPPPPVLFGSLPEKLRVASVFHGLDYAMKGPLHGAVSGRAARLPEVVGTANRVAQGLVNVEALAQTRGTPDSAQVRSMCSNLALQDCFAVITPHFEVTWGTPVAATFVADKLDEIVGKRHLIAHTAAILNISRTDLNTWPGFLDAVAQALDTVLGGQMAAIVAGTAGA
jgi:RiboL-PSP-HEPN